MLHVFYRVVIVMQLINSLKKNIYIYICGPNQRFKYFGDCYYKSVQLSCSLLHDKLQIIHTFEFTQQQIQLNSHLTWLTFHNMIYSSLLGLCVIKLVKNTAVSNSWRIFHAPFCFVFFMFERWGRTMSASFTLDTVCGQVAWIPIACITLFHNCFLFTLSAEVALAINAKKNMGDKIIVQ